MPPRQPTDTGRSTGRLGLALTLVWLPNLLLTVLIWEDRVSDAQLAAKLPVLLMAGLGLALLLQWLWRRSAVVGAGALLVAAAFVLHAGPARLCSGDHPRPFDADPGRHG